MFDYPLSQKQETKMDKEIEFISDNIYIYIPDLALYRALDPSD